MEVAEQYGDQVRIIGLPSLADLESIDGFIADTGTDGIANLPDLDGTIWRQFGVLEQRTYVYINDDGTWRRSGYGSLQADVEDLIAN